MPVLHQVSHISHTLWCAVVNDKDEEKRQRKSGALRVALIAKHIRAFVFHSKQIRVLVFQQHNYIDCCMCSARVSAKTR